MKQKKSKRLLSLLLSLLMIVSIVPLNAITFTVSAVSNEQKVYDYFKNVMKVNTAVACGVLANIKAESGFNPTNEFKEADGRISYGICQWNAGRLNNLKSFCSKNGLNYKTIDAQLAFLKHELEGSEKNAWSKVKNKANTVQGAYDAGYAWAQYFERCAKIYNGVNQFVKRGNLAKNTYWKKYGDTSPAPTSVQTDNLEYAMFPFNELNISRTNSKLDPDQANENPNGGHVKFAFDLIGSDKKVKAPFTGVITWIQSGAEHCVILQSQNKVHIANGKTDYVSIMFTHDDDISDLKVGQVIKQGQVFYAQGTFGGGKAGTFGRHLHIEAAIGKCSSLSQIRSKGAQLNDVVFLTSTTKRTKDYILVSPKNGGYKKKLTWRIVPANKPSAPKISYVEPITDIPVGEQISVFWSNVTNATNYDVYIDGVKATSIAGTSYSFKATVAKTYEVKVIARNSAGSSGDSNKLTFTAHAPSNVTFVNWDDTPLTAEPLQVPYGKDAVIPEIPVREGYTFVGWDRSCQKITEDCVIKAQYKVNTYTVKFFDSKGNVLSTQKVDYLNAATAPENVNAPTGYAFLGWSTEEYLAVKSDLNVYGIYDWGNRQLPVVATNVTAVRQQDGYYVYFDLTNYPDAITRGRAVVSLKTAEGKLIDTTESAAFSIPQNGTKIGMEVFVPSDEVATTAELIIVNSYSSGVPISAMKSVGITMAENMWSNWSDTAPAEGTYSDLETRTMYRSSDKELTTDSVSKKDGWTLYNTTSAWSAYSAWSAWSKTAVTATDERKVETRTVTDKAAYTQYRYSHYYNKSTGNTSPKDLGSAWTGPHSTGWMNSALTKDGTSSAGGAKYKSKKCATCGKTAYWYNQETRTVPAVTHIEYRYATRSLIYTYYFYRWLDWTDWTTEPITANDNKRVETKTQHRFISNGVVEDTTGVERTVTGNVGAANAGKQLSLFVYKVDEASDFTNEFVGQQSVAADGSYSFTFKLREEPSVKTGDFTVAVGLEGSNNTMIVDTIPAPKPTFEVKFFVDGHQVGETQTVEQGSAAVPPANPSKEGYTFCGWSADITNVQTNLEVDANFAINRYTVVFVDWVAETVSIGEYEHGTVLTYADAAEKEGYTFAGWEELEDMDAVVTQNMVLTAKYDKDVFEVVFYDFDGNEISRQNVEYGEAAVFPEDPVEEGMIFNGWDSEEDPFEVMSDMEAYADFIYEETCEEPYANVTTNEYTQAQTVTLTCDTPNATIYYTTDGSDPSEADAEAETPVYTAPIKVDKNCVLKFYAACDGMNSSELVTETYVISNGGVDSNLMVYADLPDYVVENPVRYNVHLETGYRYKNVFASSVQEEIGQHEADGWTANGNAFGAWSEWSMSEPEANGTIIEIETRQPDPINTTFYQYTHWKYYDETTQTYVCADEEVDGFTGEWETIELSSYLQIYSFVAGTPNYRYNNELWFNQHQITKGIVPDYLLYRYRNKIFFFYKWSDWTDEAPDEYETRETTSGNVFRYTVPASHLVTVHPLAEYGYDGSANDSLETFVVFNNEKVELELENYQVEGMTLLGFYTDDNYTTAWDLDNDVVTAKLDLYPKYEQITFTVTFEDASGQTIDEQQVAYGLEAQAPDYTPADGLVFIGWDRSFDSVTENMIVTAIVKPEDEVIRVSFDKANVSAYVDSTVQIKANVTPDDAADDTLVWSSDNTDTAAVNENGVVTAIAPGVATVTATTVDGMTASCVITVKGQGEPESVALTDNEIYVARAATRQLTYTVEPRTADNTAAWVSTNPAIATVDENGVVTGHMAGITVVIVTTANGLKDYCLVKVVGVTAESTANIDPENGVITGLTAGLDSLDSYLALTDESCELSYNGIGTDSIVYLTRNDEIIGAYTVVIFGDVDGNGWYDGTDAYFVKLVTNGMIPESALTEAQRMAADCNHDGRIDGLDVATLEQAGLLLANVNQTLPSEELQTDSVYLEYCSLIDQTVEIVESDQPAASGETAEEPARAAANVWQIMINLFKRIISQVINTFFAGIITK